MALKCGICSTGRICSDFCSAIKTSPPQEHELVAVVSRTEETATRFASTFGIQKTYSSYDEFAADPDIEVVYIGSPFIEHVRLSVLMLKAGKHVLCEKSVSDKVADVKMIHAVAKERNLFFMEGVWSRCFPVYHKMKDEIESGRLGDIQMVTAKFLRKGTETPVSGGILLEGGIYTVQFACLAYGEEPVSIQAEGDIIESGHDIDGCVILTYRKGQKACLIYSRKAHSRKNSASVDGTKGSIEIDDCFWCPSKAELPTETISNTIPEGPVPCNFPFSGGLSYEADAVRKCIREGKTQYPYYTHKDSELVHTIMEKIGQLIGRKLPNS